MELNISNDKKQKDFLQGVLDKIVIKGDYGLDRDGKKNDTKQSKCNYEVR